jgi:NAD(P)-dependent dehydrogenase (short-subunit alcohol dehydrogenase family)
VAPTVDAAGDADDVAGFIEATVEAFGGLDVLVTNKGGPPPGGFDAIDDEGWQAGFELVVLSYVRAVRAALPHLEDGGGSVVAIESTSVKRPIDGLVLSSALRPSVVATSKALAREHADEGVRFNVVLPGSMDTDRLDELFEAEAAGTELSPAEVRADWEADIPAGRLGDPRELGDVICLLASERASYATGGVYPVDGGKTPNVY